MMWSFTALCREDCMKSVELITSFAFNDFDEKCQHLASGTTFTRLSQSKNCWSSMGLVLSMVQAPLQLCNCPGWINVGGSVRCALCFFGGEQRAQMYFLAFQLSSQLDSSTGLVCIYPCYGWPRFCASIAAVECFRRTGGDKLLLCLQDT